MVNYFKWIKSINYTHCEFALSGKYEERDYQYPIQGKDFTKDIHDLVDRVTLAVRNGLHVALFMAGDGQTILGHEYNDPQGWTKGYQWLYDNLDWILGLFKDNGLYKHILFVPGYDGVFYGWEPWQVVLFGKKFRRILPDGYLGLEFNSGHIPLGEGGSDYLPGGRMQDYDVVLGEFNWPVHDDVVWQICGRLGKNYKRPSDQPINDDPKPPYYLSHEGPRGPTYFVKYEYATYQWVRGRVSSAEVQQGRNYLENLSEDIVC